MKFKRIRDLREDNDYTQMQLAEMLFVKQSTYSDYENGVINIPVEALMRLADIYDTSVDYILGLTNEIAPYSQEQSKCPPSKSGKA